MRRRLPCYLLMGCLCPAILFTFPLIFGQDSYQYWGDRYHYNLTNKYLFTRLPAETLLGPLWRDDTLAGNIWLTSIVTSPLALDILAGRLLRLSPLGIELVGGLTLYFVAVLSMFAYVRRAMGLSLEAATVAATIFAATAYWVYGLAGTPDMPMAAAWLPALLVLVHRIDALGGDARVLSPMVGLALLFYLCALHSMLASLPIALLLLMAYAWAVFASVRSVLLVGAAVGLGLVLYSPYLWSFMEAAGLSHRNAGEGFYPSQPGGWRQCLAQGGIMLSQLALGHNRYGVYLVVVLVAVVWLCAGQGWSRESPGLIRILRFAAGATVAIYAIEFLHDAINDAKRAVPLLRGWDVTRFSVFAFFGSSVLVAWMLDRSLLRPDGGSAPPQRRAALRWMLAAMAGIGCSQIAYSFSRMRELPPEIHPQQAVLYGYLLLYAAVTAGLWALVYRRTCQDATACSHEGDDRGRLWCAALCVLAVSLVTSVHAYRSGLVGSQGIGTRSQSDPVLSYAQRYAIPSEIGALAEVGAGDGRAADLTRPLNAGTWMAGSDITLLPLSGVRTLSGYSNLYPAWYARLIHVGVNGKSGSPWNIVQVEDTGRTNFDALPLLDVQRVLAGRRTALPRYRSVAGFDSGGKVLYRVEDESRLGPAFVSSGVRCMTTDEDALRVLHGASLPELRVHAILTVSDPASAPLCAGGAARAEQAEPSLVRTTRGPDRVRIEVESGPGGILTLSDTYYPGWTVLVNGVERPLLRTYTALRGVAIGPGRQSVEFLYAPRTFNRLVWLSNGCLALLLLAAATVWMRERRAADAPVR